MKSLSRLQALVRTFNEERGWRELHQVQHLAMSIVIEAAELLECFQWRSPSDVAGALREDPKFRSEIEAEVADVMIYLLSFCDVAGIDPDSAVERKIDQNSRRFPLVVRSQP
jgi:NTP pyrophosphatase (non-canonical NTP hydrolase)